MQVVAARREFGTGRVAARAAGNAARRERGEFAGGLAFGARGAHPKAFLELREISGWRIFGPTLEGTCGSRTFLASENRGMRARGGTPYSIRLCHAGLNDPEQERGQRQDTQCTDGFHGFRVY